MARGRPASMDFILRSVNLCAESRADGEEYLYMLTSVGRWDGMDFIDGG